MTVLTYKNCLKQPQCKIEEALNGDNLGCYEHRVPDRWAVQHCSNIKTNLPLYSCIYMQAQLDA